MYSNVCNNADSMDLSQRSVSSVQRVFQGVSTGVSRNPLGVPKYWYLYWPHSAMNVVESRASGESGRLW